MTQQINIKQDVEALKAVQVIDKQAYDLEQELLHIPEETRLAEEDYKGKLSILEAADKKYKECQLQQKDRELELGKKEENILKLDGQLNQLKTNKEYSAMQQEIASCKADKSMLEDKILSLMEEVAAVTQQMRQAKEQAAKFQKDLEAHKVEIAQRETALKQQVSDLKHQRKDLLDRVSDISRVSYERILPKKKGMAIVPVIGDICSACKLRLRPQLLNEVIMQDRLITCENCARILYMEPQQTN